MRSRGLFVKNCDIFCEAFIFNLPEHVEKPTPSRPCEL